MNETSSAKSEKLTVDSKLPGYRFLELFADGTINTEVFRLQNYVMTVDPALPGY